MTDQQSLTSSENTYHFPDGTTISGDDLDRMDREIADRIEAEKALTGKTLSKTRVSEIRDEITDIYKSRAETSKELAQNDSAEGSPVPYVEDFDAAIEHFGGGEGIHTLDTYTKAGGKEDEISKEDFIDVPLVIMRWWFSEGEMGEYVTFKLVTKEPVKGHIKFVMTDSSTGIRDQLKSTTETTGQQGGLLVRSGFRVSRYTWNGQPQRTYYLT